MPEILPMPGGIHRGITMATILNVTSDAAVSINPASGEEIARYPFQRAKECDRLLAEAHVAYRQWSAEPVSARVAVLSRLAGVLRKDIERLAAMVTREMGKPIAQARAELEKCATLCDWCAENGEALLADEKTSIGEQAYVSYLPIGPILGVMPWNFPYWQVMRGAAGILLAGNAYVLKHAPNVMGCAHALAEAWREAGVPDGLFTVLNVTTEAVGKVIADPRIAAVAVTGSVRAGAAIAAQAGAALKKSVLELGGSDPFIVLADAELDQAVNAAVVGRFQNTGQICIAAKRIIIERPIAEEFTRRFVDAVDKLPVGDPFTESTYIGPMARFDLRDELDAQVRHSLAEGARPLLQGGKLRGEGNYFAPTVLAGVSPAMTVFREEVFGPVASLIVANGTEHAIELANDSEFGLSGALWTANKDLARQLARRIDTGGLFVNGMSASDPRVPIGGVKKSGYGRELSYFGIREFMNAQTVWFDRR
jgi:succinate-semialdehyde dehydrogenase